MVNCKSTDHKGETSNWLVDSLEIMEHEDGFFLEFPFTDLHFTLQYRSTNLLSKGQNMLFYQNTLQTMVQSNSTVF